MTLTSAILDLGQSCFEYGQVYVALSRLSSLNGLYITKFDPSKIKAHPKVVEWLENLKSV